MWYLWDSRRLIPTTLWKDVGILGGPPGWSAGGRGTLMQSDSPAGGCFPGCRTLRAVSLSYSQMLRGLGSSTQNVSGTGTPWVWPPLRYNSYMTQVPRSVSPSRGWAQLWDQSSTVLLDCREHWSPVNKQFLTTGWPLVGNKDLRRKKKRTGSSRRGKTTKQPILGTVRSPESPQVVHHGLVLIPKVVQWLIWEANSLGLLEAGLWGSGLRRLV